MTRCRGDGDALGGRRAWERPLTREHRAVCGDRLRPPSLSCGRGRASLVHTRRLTLGSQGRRRLDARAVLAAAGAARSLGEGSRQTCEQKQGHRRPTAALGVWDPEFLLQHVGWDRARPSSSHAWAPAFCASRGGSPGAGRVARAVRRREHVQCTSEGFAEAANGRVCTLKTRTTGTKHSNTRHTAGQVTASFSAMPTLRQEFDSSNSLAILSRNSRKFKRNVVGRHFCLFF